MKTLGKVALWTLIALVGLFALAMAYLFIAYPPPGYAINVVRGLARGEPTVNEYKWRDSKPMTASPSPYYFKEEPAEAMVQALFEQNPVIDDLDDFLERNQTQAFIVIQNDTILYEKYFNGASRESIVTSFSTAKSWTSPMASSKASMTRSPTTCLSWLSAIQPFPIQ